jgi:lysylphosphatidylglycerol synthetase-like protein (DUF2156 family)
MSIATHPSPLAAIARRQRTRRLLALGLGVIGVFDLVTAVLPPSKHQLTFLLHFAPLFVSQVAAALLALCGLLLLALLRGVGRGQRQAWALACGVLVIAAVLHVARGIDGIQSALSVAMVVAMVRQREAFLATPDRRARRPVAVLVLGGAAATVALSTASVEGFLAIDRDGRNLIPFYLTLLGIAERMVGVQSVAFPARLNRFLAPTLLGVGLALVVLCVILISRPLVDRGRTTEHSRREARQLVLRHGGGTLDYFALRDDKTHYFKGDTLITYAVHGGVCVVSPDPIGPASERTDAWAAFCQFADENGWMVAVLGADASWLPIYRQGGMHSIYIGDEAVVNLAEFDLAGGHKKGLRQAVNRIDRYGYRVSFHDPRHLDSALADSLRGLMQESRRGENERGFSMTLGRLLDPNDAGLLLSVAHDADGIPVAFCQFVPAPSIDGYSLDLMRRDHGDHPNGLIDFLIVSTIRHLRDQNMTALCLNFATMRAVLTGDAGDAVVQRALRWVFLKLSRSMQIESLWRFSAKYDPEWVGRHLVYGSIEQLLPVGLAVARAESMWELPVIGRFLYPGRQGIFERRLRDNERRAA